MTCVCRTCREVKPQEEFGKVSRYKSGYGTRCKACVSLKGAEEYARNREKYKEVRAEWWQRNKEELREKRKEYADSHRELLNRLTVKWRKANPEKVLEGNREQRRKHPERYRLASKKTRAKYRDATIIQIMKWRTGGGDLTVEKWRWMVEQCGFKCVRCGTPESEVKAICKNRIPALEIDHIVPVRSGGRTDLSNIQPLCPACNNWKRIKALDFRPEEVKKMVGVSA